MKYNIISYLIGDGISNISKNKKSTFSAIVIMLVTMLTVGICLAIGKNANQILKTMQNDYPLEIYLDDGITVSEKDNLENQIRSLGYINNITYVSKDDAYYKAVEKVGSTSIMVAGYTEKVHPFPPSFVVTFTDLSKITEIAEQIKTFDHVTDTTMEDQQKDTETLIAFTRNVNITLLAIGGVLVIFSIIIIGNTIKLTVHSRRKEISIMKYVGATNNFIRAPFVVEGVIIGLIASLISLISLGALYVWVSKSLIGNSLENWLQGLDVSSGIQLLEFSQMFQEIFTIFLILGIGIGVIGSMISMKKYLKV